MFHIHTNKMQLASGEPPAFTLHTYIHTYILTLHYITVHYITLHYITLHYITLHYITLHYITLHYIHTYIHTYIHRYTHAHIYIYLDIHTHTYIYIHTHTHTHTCTNKDALTHMLRIVMFSDQSWFFGKSCFVDRGTGALLDGDPGPSCPRLDGWTGTAAGSRQSLRDNRCRWLGDAPIVRAGSWMAWKMGNATGVTRDPNSWRNMNKCMKGPLHFVTGIRVVWRSLVTWPGACPRCSLTAQHSRFAARNVLKPATSNPRKHHGKTFQHARELPGNIFDPKVGGRKGLLRKSSACLTS